MTESPIKRSVYDPPAPKQIHIEEQIPEEQDRGRRMDPELKALSAMIRLLEDLDDGLTQSRVTTYLAARYAP